MIWHELAKNPWKKPASIRTCMMKREPLFVLLFPFPFPFLLRFTWNLGGVASGSDQSLTTRPAWLELDGSDNDAVSVTGQASAPALQGAALPRQADTRPGQLTSSCVR